MQAQAQTQTEIQPTSSRPVLMLVSADDATQCQDPTVAALAGNPALQSFYTRVLPRGVAPVAGLPFYPCA